MHLNFLQLFFHRSPYMIPFSILRKIECDYILSPSPHCILQLKKKSPPMITEQDVLHCCFNWNLNTTINTMIKIENPYCPLAFLWKLPLSQFAVGYLLFSCWFKRALYIVIKIIFCMSCVLQLVFPRLPYFS